MPPEKQIENLIKRYVNEQPNSVCVKLHGDALQPAGLPDLVGGLNGVPFFVEVKRGDGQGAASPLQSYWTVRLKHAGYVSGIVSSLSEFKALFDV